MRAALGSSETARQRQKRDAIARETVQADRAAANERRDRAETAAREREERDAKVRARAMEVMDRFAEARRNADDLAIDFESGCQQLAAGTATIDDVKALQLARDEARRELEIYGLAAADLRADPALAGRHSG